jgi:hypothetical protein
MPGLIRLEFFHFENGEELMLAQLKESVAFPALQLLRLKTSS